jgi:hypothetical protein
MNKISNFITKSTTMNIFKSLKLHKFNNFLKFSKYFFDDQASIKKDMAKQVKLTKSKQKQLSLANDIKVKIKEINLPFSEEYQNKIYLSIRDSMEGVFIGGSNNIIIPTILLSLWYKIYINDINKINNLQKVFIIVVNFIYLFFLGK